MDDIQEFLLSINQFRSRIDQSSYGNEQKVVKTNQLYILILVTISDETKVHFTSLFSRLSYLVTTYQIPPKESYLLHAFRKSDGLPLSPLLIYRLGQLAISIILKYCLDHEEDLTTINEYYQKIQGNRPFERKKFVAEWKVLFKSIDLENKRVQAQSFVEPFDNLIIAFDRSDRNEDYSSLLEKANEAGLLPLTVNLLTIEIDSEGILYPASIVFEPDYLYDVTAISECFGPFSIHEGGYLLRKFKKKALSTAILIGNISNFFLDELIVNPNAEFGNFTKDIFAYDPLSIALLSDQEVREMMHLLERHFKNIKHVVEKSFPKINVLRQDCHIEPSFYSSKYGIQGRLDLFSIKDNYASIIELKSGSVYRPNTYGLANNHFHQTLIYDLLIESVYGHKVKRNNFILYSKENNKHLRFAPALKSEQREAIKVRNTLYLHDRQLLVSEDFIKYYEQYATEHKQQIRGYARTDFDHFLKSFRALEKLERTYCSSIFQFSLRELFISKLGIEGSENAEGLASLWLQPTDTKKEQFNILNHLSIADNKSDQDIPVIVLAYSDQTAPLSNFRVGDLGVLYPSLEGKNSILSHQIFKVTVLSIDEKAVTVRLRSRQENAKVFDQYDFWHIEHDSLENGYYEMTRSIYEFALAMPEYRQLIMGRRPPGTYLPTQVNSSHHLTKEQKSIFSNIVHSKDYYLLWGPPGTGKTSVMLREIARHHIVHTDDRILLLAYTNRAVDEICEALLSIEEISSFIRIGSKYSTQKKFHSYLLNEQLEHICTRATLREKLTTTKVYVGTIASVIGKVALFELIKFDLAVIDEASQILESSLIGLLSRVKKFVLIGDHLQLPAIVRQEEQWSQVENEEMLHLGIKQFSASLFERMYQTALRNQWNHAIGQLKYQGRMHVDIMSFVNKQFYKNQLLPLPQLARLKEAAFFELRELQLPRISFVGTAVDDQSESIKVNDIEAQQVAELCDILVQFYKQSNTKFTNASIGVITPYRAQIAAIKRKLRKLIPGVAPQISVDTVERYQGSSREIIVMSACMNYSFQLKSLISLSIDGVDRKLNVAITRAKEHFILVGNKSILEKNQVYQELIDQSGELDAILEKFQ